MGLEIKVLDLGDIELESSFLVLGHDCGVKLEVPTLGFLILGGERPSSSTPASAAPRSWATSA